MRQSEQVRLRTEIAQLKATLHQLRFALPLKKAAEEAVAAWWDTDDPPNGHFIDRFGRRMENLKEALENKRRYEAVSDEPV